MSLNDEETTSHGRGSGIGTLATIRPGEGDMTITRSANSTAFSLEWATNSRTGR